MSNKEKPLVFYMSGHCEEEAPKMEKKGYEWRASRTGGGYWVKCTIPTEDRVPIECSRCGKGGKDITSLDIGTLDDWHLCRECFIYCIKDREDKIVKEAILTQDYGILDQRGAKRWIKNNMPPALYKELYEPQDAPA